MNKRIIVCAAACLMSGCATRQTVLNTGAQTRSADEFLLRISYPYQAPEARRNQIERGISLLHTGDSEAKVLQVLGCPDYAAEVRDLDKHSKEVVAYAEIWHYVHSLDRYIEPDYRGKMITVTLSNKTEPRTVEQITRSGGL